MRTIYTFMLFCSLIWLTSCSSHDDSDIHSYADTPVQFGIGFTARLGGDSRAQTDNDLVTTWQTGDAIGLYVVKGDADLQDTDNYAHNVKLTCNADGTWITDAPIFYPGDGQSLHFYAYYPYSKGVTNLITRLFEVATNQSSAAGYNQSILMVAKTRDVVPSNNPVPLNFSQATSLLQVEVVKGSDDNIPDLDDNLTLTLSQAQFVTTLSWEDAFAPSGNTTNIVMHRVTAEANTAIFRALIPAQTLSATAVVNIVQPSADAEIRMNYTGVQSAELRAGNVHKYQETLTPHQYAVGDVYPHTGIPQGIVFWVNPDDNRHGLIVSLDEGEGTWSSSDVATNAVSETNGLANMRTVYELNAGYSNHPAFAWVHTKNGGGAVYYYHSTTGVWYLPSVEELRMLAAGYNGKVYEDGSFDYESEECVNARTAFNKKLVAAGGMILYADTYDSYYSSTEYNASMSYCVGLVDAGYGFASKSSSSSSTYVRAIMSF